MDANRSTQSWPPICYLLSYSSLVAATLFGVTPLASAAKILRGLSFKIESIAPKNESIERGLNIRRIMELEQINDRWGKSFPPLRI